MWSTCRGGRNQEFDTHDTQKSKSKNSQDIGTGKSRASSSSRDIRQPHLHATGGEQAAEDALLEASAENDDVVRFIHGERSRTHPEHDTDFL